MGGIVTRQSIPESPQGSAGRAFKASRGPGSSSGLRGVLAGSLDSGTECFELPNLVQHLRIYQHFESGEIILLINENLSDATTGVADATEWVQVFLNTQNEQYLERIETHVAIRNSTMSNANVSSDDSGPQPTSMKESKESYDEYNKTDNSGLASSFNEFSLSMEKLDKRTHPRALERKDDDDEAKEMVLFKDPRMNEEYDPFRYNPSYNRLGGELGSSAIADTKDDFSRGARESGQLGPHSGGGGRRAFPSGSHETMQCPSCMCYFTTVRNAGGSGGNGDGPVLFTENFATHKRLCGFSLYVMPRFSQLGISMQPSLQELSKSNEVGMERALFKAMRTFEKRSALNNCTLLLIKKVMNLGEGHSLDSLSDPGGGSYDPLDDLESRIVEVGKEVHSFLLLLRKQEAERRAEEQKEGRSVEGRPSAGRDSDHHDGDSDDEGPDVGIRDSNVNGLHAHAYAHAAGSWDESGHGHTAHESMPGESMSGKALAIRSDKESRFFCSLEELGRYIKVVEKVLEQCNAKKVIMRNFQSVTLGIRDFEFLRMLGKGGFASVHLVRNRNDGRRYALKALSKGPMRTTEAQTQLLNEQHVSLMSTKYQPNAFVNLIGSFHTPNFCCLVLEFCPGGDLLNLLNNVGYLPQQTVSLIVAEVIQAMSWLHTHGVLHRDIKPDNLFVTRAGHVKLGDFGVCTRMCSVWSATAPSSGSNRHLGPFNLHKTNSDGSDVSFKMPVVIGTGSGYPAKDGGANSVHSNSSPSEVSSGNISPQYAFDPRLWAAMDYDITPDVGQTSGNVSHSGSSSPRGRSMSGGSGETSSMSMVYRLNDGQDHLHYTMVGNGHYQSPECVSGVGYDRSEDWWAVGVLCFHLVAGITPFESPSGSSEAEEKDNIVLARILWGNVPADARLSAECRDFIKCMLQEVKADRLSYQGYHAVREHVFFESINFESLWKGIGPLKVESNGSGSKYVHEELGDDVMHLPTLWTDTNDNLLSSITTQQHNEVLSKFKTINDF